MFEEILVNVILCEMCVVVIENGMLQELYIECGWCCGVVGNIYKGKVQWVMLGMQVVFVEVGLECVVFLYVNDVIWFVLVVSVDIEGIMLLLLLLVLIVELLCDGQDIVVQVVKDLIGIKGVCLIIQISIFLCYMVLLLQFKVVGVLVWIEDEVEWVCLKSLVIELLVQYGGYGYIVCINVEGQFVEVIVEDVVYLLWVWNVVEWCGCDVVFCSVIYEDLSLLLCLVCDLICKDVDKVKVDFKEIFV